MKSLVYFIIVKKKKKANQNRFYLLKSCFTSEILFKSWLKYFGSVAISLRQDSAFSVFFFIEILSQLYFSIQKLDQIK